MARILLVDDEPDVRLMLVDALRMHNHHVVAVGTPAEAIERAKAEGFDIAIVDYVLPRMRGLELISEIRAINPFIRSIVISGQIDHDRLDAASVEQQLKERVEVDQYLPKPVTGPLLLAAVDALAAKSGGVNWSEEASKALKRIGVKRGEVRAVDRKLAKSRKKQRS
jgi:CheY-like chemotaxis protein